MYKLRFFTSTALNSFEREELQDASHPVMAKLMANHSVMTASHFNVEKQFFAESRQYLLHCPTYLVLTRSVFGKCLKYWLYFLF